ncbi:ATP-binding protein [Bernardetia sp. Wsw4-3y2]|uniref:ATP-binding protein n=1 Tax=Bernardetia sp. Wsw4-3y2 TaxID=3127471 RepID=UPI0030CEDECA
MTSPFKVLEAYGRKDKEIFFGRDAEIQLLFKKTTESNLVLVYGASGTGKTSLVHCGLPICFSSDDWLPLHVRRKDHIGTALLEETNKYLQRKLKPHTPLHLAIKALHMTFFRPIYVIIDQFEELYISGSKEEQNQFYDFIQTVLSSEYNCKVILVMREEYLADLSEFEECVPQLFDYRVRVEKMRRTNAKEVILKSAEAFNIQVEYPEETADLIVSQVAEERSLIELTYLQIYLDRLYELAKSKQGVLAGYTNAVNDSWEERVTFNPELVKELSTIGDVLGEYLEEQVKKVQNRLPKTEERQVWTILNLLVTDDGTRVSMDLHEATNLMYSHGASKENITFCLEELSKVRIIHLSEQRVELAHDSLALKIIERLTTEEKNLSKAKEILQTGIKTYQNTGEVLSKNSLSLIEPHLETLQLTHDEQELITKSKRRVKANKIIKTVSLIIIIFMLGILAAWALRERSIAIDRKEEIEMQNEQIKLQLNSTMQLSKNLDDQLGKLVEKEKILEEVLKLDKSTYRVIENKNKEINQLGVTVDALKERIDTKNKLQEQIERKAKANELLTDALLKAEYNPNYAIRLAETANKIYPSKNAQTAIENIYREHFMRNYPTNKNISIYENAKNLLKGNQIPKISQTQKEDLGITKFEK